MTVTIEELKKDAERIVERAHEGETVQITDGGKVVAEIRPSEPAATKPSAKPLQVTFQGKVIEEIQPPTDRTNLRPYGLAKGEFVVPDDFDDPLPDDILEDFGEK